MTLTAASPPVLVTVTVYSRTSPGVLGVAEHLGVLAAPQGGAVAGGAAVTFVGDETDLGVHGAGGRRLEPADIDRGGAVGRRIGPELTGVGSRFSRIYLIESILEPGRTIAPGYETVLVAMKDGRVFAGTRVAETAETLTVGDNKGEKHVLEKAGIEERRAQPLSTMPDGLEKPLTAAEFIDLIAFLVGQKEQPP